MTQGDALAAEMATARRSVFDPQTLFRAPAMTGRFVNVADAGYRSGRDPQSWPPPADSMAVFVFGGSTAFGQGLPDGETIPAWIEHALRARGMAAAVYNFASPNHASEQERARFFHLVLDGHAPRAAVFLDGFAELVAPYYAHVIEHPLRRAIAKRTRLEAVRDRLMGAPADYNPATPERDTAATVERYLANVNLIRAAAAAFQVQPLFAWQPVPCYAYPGGDRGVHVGGHNGAEHIIAAICEGYDRMAQAKTILGDDDFLWLADLQAGRTDSLYVDPDHYNADFTREIGEVIAERLARLIG